MTVARRGLVVGVTVAGLFIAAGLRNMFLPGFLSISSRHGTGVTELLSGLAILALTFVGWSRRPKEQAK
jgi:hypothetical protein